MFPAQTSLIPATVALARFAESNGFGGIYPFWYLGSTPFRYLTGPVVPGILVALHKLTSLDYFQLSFLFLIFSFLFGSFGWGVLAWKLSGNKLSGFIVALLSLFLPWHWVSGLALSELSATVALALTPWVLLAFARLSNHQSPITNHFPPILLFALLLLTNTVSSIPAIIGLILLGITIHKRWEEGIKKAILIILFGWFLTAWWYTPGYWLTILGAPSLGGRPAAEAFVWVINLLRGFVPFILAIFVVFWGARVKDRYLKFALSWLGLFGLLTLFRFFADPDFWTDWTAWMGEVEVGIALLVGYLIAGAGPAALHPAPTSSLVTAGARAGSPPRVTRSIIYSLLFAILLFASWFFAWQKRDFWLPRKEISNSVEFKIAKVLSQTVKPGERVFLSGTTAFWLNAFSASWRISQVRGGVDQASVDKSWQQAVWQIRFGQDPPKTERFLKSLGVSYLVVHTPRSQEFYHDFSNIGKFDQIPTLRKIYEREGDIIYRVED